MKSTLKTLIQFVLWLPSAYFALNGDFARASYALLSCLFVSLAFLIDAIDQRPINIEVHGKVDLGKTMLELAKAHKKLGMIVGMIKKEQP